VWISDNLSSRPHLLRPLSPDILDDSDTDEIVLMTSPRATLDGGSTAVLWIHRLDESSCCWWWPDSGSVLTVPTRGPLSYFGSTNISRERLHGGTHVCGRPPSADGSRQALLVAQTPLTMVDPNQSNGWRNPLITVQTSKALLVRSADAVPTARLRRQSSR
jgi:hypothetical protein